MTFIAPSGLPTKANVARRTTSGQKHILQPVVAGEESLYLSNCNGCPIKETHAVCEGIGFEIPCYQTRHYAIDEENRWDYDSLHDLFTAIWLWSYAQNGMITNILYNAGGANNAAQSQTYQILAASGNYLTLSGSNPRAIGNSFSTVNPDWDGTNGRLQFSVTDCALPPGAMVQFEYPSVLYGKIFPLVKRIIPPQNNDAQTTFQIETTCEVTNAIQPYDLTFPAENYYCSLWWHEFFPESYPNLQTPYETQFTYKTLSLPSGVPYPHLYEFRDSYNEPTRVLYPDMGNQVFQLWASGQKVDDTTATSRLTTTQTGGIWQTTVNVSGWQNIYITYCPQATELDSYRVQFAGTCANRQKDHSNSYGSQLKYYCGQPNASQRSTFSYSCWQPDCSHFCLGHESDSYKPENMNNPPADLRLSKHWDFWSRCSWYVYQLYVGGSGARAFYIVRPQNGGSSFAEILGGFRNTVPMGYFPTKYAWHPPSMGLLALTDDGLELATGAFYAAPYTDHNVDAMTLQRGTIPVLASGYNNFQHESQLANVPDRNEYYPISSVCNVYDYATSGNWLGCRTKKMGNMESFVANIKNEGLDFSLNDEIQGLF